MQQVIIIGGGLAGLCSAIALAREGIGVTVVEKRAYPFHRVCGEYISNEVLPYLHSIGAGPAIPAPAITQFLLSSPSGKALECPLDLGGFGISRYAFDHHLYKVAAGAGAHFITGTQVNEVNFEKDHFHLKLSDGTEQQAQVVIGSFGKRSKLDRALDRPFFNRRSPYIGVKYHIKGDFADDQIALHNFEDGYCGLNPVEDGKYCLCYLTTRENLRRHGSIPEMEEKVLHKNPLLKDVFSRAEHLYSKPEVINEISFLPKEAVKDHILMAGDAAGMIAPLCGNGMAMAIHASKMASEEIIGYFNGHQNRQSLEERYTRRWKKEFAMRLWTGRKIQSLFGAGWVSEAATGFMRRSPWLLKQVMKRTHGQPF